MKQLVVEKERSYFVNKTALTKMLPQVYLTCFQSQLSAAELLTLEIVVWLLQAHKQVRIERLAALFPEPIKERKSPSLLTKVPNPT